MSTSEIHPCWHMRRMVPQLADGTLHGFLRTYTIFHLERCTQCRRAFEALKKVIAKVRGAGPGQGQLDAHRRDALERAWQSIEDERAPPD